MWGNAAAAARELGADVDDAASEIDVVPSEREDLRKPHPRIDSGRKQRSIVRTTRGE